MAAYARNAVAAAKAFTDRFSVYSGEFGAWPTHYYDESMAEIRHLYQFQPTVDGLLDRYWQRLEALPIAKNVIAAPASAADFSAKFRYFSSDRGLAIYAEVTDDIVLGRAEAAAYDQDSLEIFLDVAGITDGPYQASSVQLTFPQAGAAFQSQEIPGVQSQSKIVSGGVHWEVFIPWSGFGLSAKPRRISLDVQVNDGDDESGRKSKLAWFAEVDDAYQNLGSLRPVSGNIKAYSAADAIQASCTADERKACLDQFLLSFGERAFRRPLSAEQVARYQSLYASSQTDESLQDLISALLVAPEFLYRIDDSNSTVPGSVDQYTVASRISYALWKSMPARELYEAAQAGLLTPANRKAFDQAWRSSRAQIGLADFITSLLEINQAQYALKDAEAYPNFNSEVGLAIDLETWQFIRHSVFDSARPLDDLWNSRVSYVTADLNPILGTSASGSAWQQVQLPAQRAGILTRPGFLSTHAKDANSDHIARGVTILDHVLCSPITDPPGNLGTEDPQLDAAVSPRKNFESLVSQGSCAGCHNKIDPVGFAFDNFDAIGAVRSELGGHPIDTTGQMPAGFGFNTVKDAVDASSKFAGSPRVSKCITRQALTRVVGFLAEDTAQGCSLAAAQGRPR